MTTVDVGPTQTKVDWYRTTLEPSVLKELNQRSNFLGAAQTLTHLASYALTFAFSLWAWSTESWGLLAAGLFFHGMVCAFCINAVHELIHHTVFKTPWLNEFFAHLFALLNWNNNRFFHISHMEHHRYTLHPPDDLEVVNSPAPYTFWGVFLQGLINPRAIFHITGQFRLASGRLKGDWEEKLLADEQIRRPVVAWSRFMVMVHIGVAVASLSTGYWIIVVLFSLNPLYGGLFMHLCNNTQHVGLPSRVNDFRLNCRTVILNPVLRFFYWHMNYHIEHHMYAAVPCYNLGKLHKAISHELPHCPRGLLETWTQIGAIMLKQRFDPNYVDMQLCEVDGSDAKGDAAMSAASPTSDSSRAAARSSDFKIWECQICGFLYDEEKGWPDEGILPGTRWEDVPEDFVCPDCGVAKSDFDMKEFAPPAPSQPGFEAEPGVVVIGTGLAGYTVARELRKRDPELPIHMITRDDGAAYYKPLISKSLAAGKRASDIATNTAAEMAERFNLQISTHSSVEQLDTDSKTLSLNGRPLPYRSVIMATGARARMPLIEGDAELFKVNDLKDYEALQSRLAGISHVTVIGAGLIGSEMANDLSRAGKGVRVVEVANECLSGLAPSVVAEGLADQLRSEGVEFTFGTSVTKAIQERNSVRVSAANGEEWQTDIVIAAIGLVPNTQCAELVGAAVDRGILVNDSLESSVADIYALGDCAVTPGGWHPFVATLQDQAHRLADHLTGTPTSRRTQREPVRVATSSCPIVVMPPRGSGPFDWQAEGAGPNRVVRCFGSEGQLLGFALSGTAVAKEKALLGELAA